MSGSMARGAHRPLIRDFAPTFADTRNEAGPGWSPPLVRMASASVPEGHRERPGVRRAFDGPACADERVDGHATAEELAVLARHVDRPTRRRRGARKLNEPAAEDRLPADGLGNGQVDLHD